MKQVLVTSGAGDLGSSGFDVPSCCATYGDDDTPDGTCLCDDVCGSVGARVPGWTSSLCRMIGDAGRWNQTGQYSA